MPHNGMHAKSQQIWVLFILGVLVALGLEGGQPLDNFPKRGSLLGILGPRLFHDFDETGIARVCAYGRRHDGPLAREHAVLDLLVAQGTWPRDRLRDDLEDCDCICIHINKLCRRINIEILGETYWLSRKITDSRDMEIQIGKCVIRGAKYIANDRVPCQCRWLFGDP